jgi:hypothetical protein
MAAAAVKVIEAMTPAAELLADENRKSTSLARIFGGACLLRPGVAIRLAIAGRVPLSYTRGSFVSVDFERTSGRALCRGSI